MSMYMYSIVSHCSHNLKKPISSNSYLCNKISYCDIMDSYNHCSIYLQLTKNGGLILSVDIQYRYFIDQINLSISSACQSYARIYFRVIADTYCTTYNFQLFFLTIFYSLIIPNKNYSFSIQICLKNYNILLIKHRA